MLLSPVLGATIFANYQTTSILLFSFLSFTDFFDGYIARNYPKQKSKHGELIDPIADKAMTTCTLLPLTLNGVIPPLLSNFFYSKDDILFMWIGLIDFHESRIQFTFYTDIMPARAQEILMLNGAIFNFFFAKCIYSDREAFKKCVRM